MGAISYVRGLRVLRIEDLHCRLEEEAVTDLRALTQVTLPATDTPKHTAIVAYCDSMMRTCASLVLIAVHVTACNCGRVRAANTSALK